MVLAEPAAGAGFAKLTDFGVAHVVSAESLTRTGDLVGTLVYMSPEQAEGARVSSASDVYSLALTLYEAWTATNPVRGGSPAATARRLGRRLPALSTLRADLPAGLCEQMDTALDPEPDLRPPLSELRAELAAAEPRLDDVGGLVEPATLRRVGLPALGRGAAHDRDAPPTALRLAQRAGAGLAGGALVLGLLELGPEPPFSSLTAAALATLAVALLPRLGWLCSAAALCLWFASPEADRQGVALVVAVGAAAVPLLLPRAGLCWSLPVLAPLLGTIALAPAFVVVAGLAGTAWRRAGLAAAGALWLVLGEAIAGMALLFGVPDGRLPLDQWEGSLVRGAENGVEPLAATPALAVAVVWAAFAVLLPLVVRGRWLGFDLVGAGLWALGLVAAQVALGDLLAPEVATEQARGLVAGTLVAALVAVSVARMRPRPEAWHAPRVTTA
jgi:serine/threonine-protein kinase